MNDHLEPGRRNGHHETNGAAFARVIPPGAVTGTGSGEDEPDGDAAGRTAPGTPDGVTAVDSGPAGGSADGGARGGGRPTPPQGDPRAADTGGMPSAAAEPAEPAEPEEPTVDGVLAVDGQLAADSESAESEQPAEDSTEPRWKKNLAGGLAFLRRRLTGDYTIDEFGYDEDFTRNVLMPPARLLYEKWFRVETIGIQNVPMDSGALLVANHSGTIAVDAAMLALGVADHHPAGRPLRMLGADLVFDTPFLGPLARKAGNTLACHPDAERLLDRGELVAVFPEGFKGVGKPYSQRYRLQRFGRGGFVSAAVRMGVPIIPVSIVGAEEIYPMLANIKPLARALGLPYFPVTPTFPWLGPLGAIPLPSKWYIEFGTPIPTDTYPSGSAEDPMVVFDLTDHVRETIQQTLYQLLMRRGHAFLG